MRRTTGNNGLARGDSRFDIRPIPQKRDDLARQDGALTVSS